MYGPAGNSEDENSDDENSDDGNRDDWDSVVDVDAVLARAPSASLEVPAAVAVVPRGLRGLRDLDDAQQGPLWRRTQARGASCSCPCSWVGGWGC